MDGLPYSPDQPFINTVRPDNASPNEGNDPPRIPPRTPQIDPADPCQGCTEHCRPDQTPWWKHAMELSAILVGIAVACIYYRQLDAMTSQLIIQRQTTEPALVQNQLAIHYTDQKIWAIVRAQNNGLTDALFIQVAGKIELRTSDPTPQEGTFSDSDLVYVQKPTTLRGPYASTQAIADSQKIYLQQSIVDSKDPRRFYIWGKIRFQDGGNVLQPEYPFCAYAAGATVIQIVQNSPGFIGPWTPCGH